MQNVSAHLNNYKQSSTDYTLSTLSICRGRLLKSYKYQIMDLRLRWVERKTFSGNYFESIIFYLTGNKLFTFRCQTVLRWLDIVMLTNKEGMCQI